MKYRVSEWETTVAEHAGLQLVERLQPHTWYDIYFYGMHLSGFKTSNEGWGYYYDRIGANHQPTTATNGL